MKLKLLEGKKAMNVWPSVARTLVGSKVEFFSYMLVVQLVYARTLWLVNVPPGERHLCSEWDGLLEVLHDMLDLELRVQAKSFGEAQDASFSLKLL